MIPTIKITKAPMRTRCSCQVPTTRRMQVNGKWQTVPITIKCAGLATVIADGALMCEKHLAAFKKLMETV